MALLLVLIFVLGGCANAAPSNRYEECFREARTFCIQAVRQELREEIHAGFYNGAGISQSCGEWAEEVCPPTYKQLPPRQTVILGEYQQRGLNDGRTSP